MKLFFQHILHIILGSVVFSMSGYPLFDEYRAYREYVSGNIDAARARFGQAVIHDSTNWRSLYNLGTIALNAEEFAEAERHFQRVVELQPDNMAAQERLELARKKRREAEEKQRSEEHEKKAEEEQKKQSDSASTEASKNNGARQEGEQKSHDGSSDADTQDSSQSRDSDVSSQKGTNQNTQSRQTPAPQSKQHTSDQKQDTSAPSEIKGQECKELDSKQSASKGDAAQQQSGGQRQSQEQEAYKRAGSKEETVSVQMMQEIAELSAEEKQLLAHSDAADHEAQKQLVYYATQRAQEKNDVRTKKNRW